MGVFCCLRKARRWLKLRSKRGCRMRLFLQRNPVPCYSDMGVIHPSFNSASKSKLIRNGVGVVGGSAIFVISEKPVTFYELAVFFRDVLHCEDAPYLDGVVSTPLLAAPSAK